MPRLERANVVAIPELIQQVTQATWTEVLGPTAKNINANRRDLQRAYLDRMSDIVATPPAGMPAAAARTTSIRSCGRTVPPGSSSRWHPWQWCS